MKKPSLIFIVFSIVLNLFALDVSAYDVGWIQYGNVPTHAFNTKNKGPSSGVSSLTCLPPSVGTGSPCAPLGSGVGALIDSDGDVYVTSYGTAETGGVTELGVYSPAGSLLGTFDFASVGVKYGPRSVPYIDEANNLIYTGAEGTGSSKKPGFHVIEIDKSNPSAYVLTLKGSDMSVGTIETSPLMVNGTVYVAGQSGNIYGFQYNGTQLTQITNSPLALNETITGSIAMYYDEVAKKSKLVVATQSGNLYVINTDLTMAASNTANQGIDEYYSGVTIAMRPKGRFGTSPVALLGVSGTGSNAGSVRAIDLKTMKDAWSLPLSPGKEIVTNVALLFPYKRKYRAVAASTDGNLYGIDLAGGAKKWTYSMGAGGYTAPVVDRGNQVYVVDGASKIHSVKGLDGTIPNSGWPNSQIMFGGTTDDGSMAIGPDKTLVVGVGEGAYICTP